jgi:hypothetical protein
MRYTLSRRFQGGFLGVAIGEILAAYLAAHPSGAQTWFELNLGDLPSLIAESSVPSWGKWGIEQMRQLTGYSSELAKPFSQSLVSAGLAITLMPLAFFYHEDGDLFERQVQQRLAQWQLPTELGIGTILVGQAIGLILREQLQPLELIPQLLANVPLAPKYTALIEQLTQVQEWLIKESSASLFSTHRLAFAPSLSTTPVSLETIPIALSLYAFLSTPEDFRLSLLRVAQIPAVTSSRSLVCSLTAAFSGTHNGKGGLPQDWRKALYGREGRSPLSLLWDVKSEHELLQCIDRFISSWSGMHNPTEHNLRSEIPTAVALPRIIRPV